MRIPKSTSWRIHVCATVAGLILVTMIAAAGKQQPTTPTRIDNPRLQPRPITNPDDAQMRRMIEANLPGPSHQDLARLAGEYATLSKFRPQPSGAETQSAGAATLTSILDGRFLREENSGTKMGQSVKGMRLYGYNNATRQYETSRVYTGSTAILNMTGTSSDFGTTINFSGSFIEPTAGKENLRAVLRRPDDSHFVVQLIGVAPDGSDFTVLETTYTRKK